VAGLAGFDKDEPAMATPLPKGPAFLEELSPEATLTMTVLQGTITGAEAVSHIIRTLVTLYASTHVSFRGSVEGRDFINYEPTLVSGQAVEAVVTLVRGEDRLIRHINIGYSPLDGALALAGSLEKALASQ
jgi:hypothetical protein